MPTEIEETGQVHSADEGETVHGGAELRGQSGVPKSTMFEGLFGRMFRNLPAPAHQRTTLEALGKGMSERDAADQDNPGIPSGYTYLGQFIDHDITFDPVSQLSKFNDPDALHDFRSPRFDLDSVYGAGPTASPYLYEAQQADFRGIGMLVGQNPPTGREGRLDRIDLQRNRQERAVIPDPRNDENIIVGQLHLAFLLFHNRVVRRLFEGNANMRGPKLFEEARRLATWHYQWVVVHDFLSRIVGQPLHDAIFTPSGSSPVTLKFFEWENQPFIPVEFSVAAYRFGHSMVRPVYDLNDSITEIPIFSGARTPGQLEHLGGFRPIPEFWSIDWSKFVRIGRPRPQLARKINTKLAQPLLKLPLNIDRKRNSLATLNLRRAKALQLPSGQSVAAAMSSAGVTPIPQSQLGLRRFGLTDAQRAELEADTPLWYYILREAEINDGGAHLGAVGGRIVAEVLVGLLVGDPNSFISQQPGWTPTGIPAKKAGDFTLSDLLKFATKVT